VVLATEDMVVPDPALIVGWEESIACEVLVESAETNQLAQILMQLGCSRARGAGVFG